MARLWSCGFELNSLTAEGFSVLDNSPTFSSSVYRSGVYSLECTKLQSIQYQFASSGINIVYVRTYLYIQTLPGVDNNPLIMNIGSIDGDLLFGLTLRSTGQLDGQSDGTGTFSNLATLSSGIWYRIEIFIDATTTSSTVIQVRLNGSQVSNSTSSLGDLSTPTAYALNLGLDINGGDTITGKINFDDFAINDSSDSFQNSWPGEGSIIHLRPNAVGDSSQWVPTSGSNYTNVSEITPDDATTLVSDVVLNESDLYQVTEIPPRLIPNITAYNVVQIGIRFRNDVADATTAFKAQVKNFGTGTISQSSAITPNSTTWKTNATAVPYNHPLTLYQDPDSVNWTHTTISAMQIGQKSTLIGVNKNQVSTIWALVEYTGPLPVSTPENYPKYIMVGNGMSRSESAT